MPVDRSSAPGAPAQWRLTRESAARHDGGDDKKLTLVVARRLQLTALRRETGRPHCRLRWDDITKFANYAIEPAIADYDDTSLPVQSPCVSHDEERQGLIKGLNPPAGHIAGYDNQGLDAIESGLSRYWLRRTLGSEYLYAQWRHDDTHTADSATTRDDSDMPSHWRWAGHIAGYRMRTAGMLSPPFSYLLLLVHRDLAQQISAFAQDVDRRPLGVRLGLRDVP